MPIHPANFDHATNRRITALRREAQLITPYLNPDRPSPDSPLVAALRHADNAGDWDVYLTTDELLSFINLQKLRIFKDRASRRFAFLLRIRYRNLVQ